MFAGYDLTIATLLRLYPWRVALTWLMVLGETVFMALVPLFIGFAIDGLTEDRLAEFWQLAGLLALLIGLSVLRRVYDTRVYGTIRADFGKVQVERGSNVPVSALNARLGMGRELVEFLEETLPMVMAGVVQLAIALVVLYAFAPLLAISAGIGAAGSAGIYILFHGRFYRLNRALNQQSEKQVRVLELRSARPVLTHLLRLRRFEVRLSDSEALLYGLVFLLLLISILFNLWYATAVIVVSSGAIFSIVSYSWDVVEGTLTLPMTLQNWTRLSEIMRRLNAPIVSAS
ncbi:MAG: ABC transporter six-transmembrane domain-containing protein [Pseudomonadota bacterium]